MRLYNGCPDSELQKIINRKDSIKKFAFEKGIRLTYFPAEGQYMAFDKTTSEILSEFHDDLEDAFNEAVKRQKVYDK